MVKTVSFLDQIHKMKKVALMLLIINVPTAVLGDPWIPEVGEHPLWMRLFETNLNTTRTLGPNIRVIFYGDSITAGWAWPLLGKSVWDRTYAPLGAVNYGISGDMTQHVLWRIINGEVDGLNPKLVVLKIGTNNLGVYGNYAIPDTTRGLLTIVRELRQRLPQTKILLLGILPCIDAESTERSERVNDYISLLDNKDTLRFLNMTDVFYQGNGQFHENLYIGDLLHLSRLGYEKWNETMWSLFEEMMNSESTEPDSGCTNSAGLVIGVNLILTFMMALIISRV